MLLAIPSTSPVCVPAVFTLRVQSPRFMLSALLPGCLDAAPECLSVLLCFGDDSQKDRAGTFSSSRVCSWY